jgi:hypothetical protein
VQEGISKMRKWLFVLIGLTFQGVCFGTIFFPMPFEKQVEEATFGVEVYLSSTKVFRNALGAIVTEYSFDVLEAYNLKSEDLENQKLKLTMPGGTVNGLTSIVDGAPQFNLKEKTFLLLKKIESTLYLSNFTLGKFKVEEDKGKIFYISDVFPTDPHIGRIEKNKMIELMKSKWKTSFQQKAKTVKSIENESSKARPISAIFKMVQKRQPAQIAEDGHVVPLFFWGAILIVVSCFGFIFFKLSKSEHQHKRE